MKGGGLLKKQEKKITASAAGKTYFFLVGVYLYSAEKIGEKACTQKSFPQNRKKIA